AVAVVLLLGLIFAGLIGNALRIVYGTPPADAAHDASDHADIRGDWRAYALTICALAPLALVMLLFGIHVPGHVGDLLDQVAAVLRPPGEVAP
ncbi:MAG: hypothetical protein ACRDJH_15125, partial [Thermomicrobiales bacterium]